MSSGSASEAAGRADIQTIDRVGQILALFDDTTTSMTAVSVAAALGLNRTTAHRYLASMLAEDLLAVSTNPRGYRLGSLILRLGGLTAGQDRVVAIAEEPMGLLADELATTTALSLWTATGPVVARVHEPQQRVVRLTFRVGTVMPIDTAQAAIFLAFRRPSDELEHSIGLLPEPTRSITAAKAAETRRTGHATAVNEPSGIWCLAVPVFDSTGVRAALALVDSLGSMPASAFPHRLARLQATADGLSARMGGLPHGPRVVET